MSASVNLSIIIVNWNTKNFLAKCLDSIYAQMNAWMNERSKCSNVSTFKLDNTETFVVDNASTDGSPDMVCERYPWVNLVASSENLGFACANNLAVERSKGEFILLLNPDTFIHKGALHRLFAFLNEHPDVGAVGPKLINPDGSLQVSVTPAPSLSREAWRLFHLDRLCPLSQYPRSTLQEKDAQDVDVLMGACLMLRREVYDDIGLFDEQFFMYSEEVDLCLRIQQAGWRICWLPDAVVTHYGAGSTSQVADEMFIELYRNKVKFFRKHRGNAYAGAYKVLLYLVAFSRWLPEKLLFLFSDHRDEKLHMLSIQYANLIRELAGF